MFDAINQALGQAGALMDAAETHGIICGFLCAADEKDDDLWLKYVLSQQTDNEPSSNDCRRVLLKLKDYIQDQLNSPEFVIQLLLPDDEAMLIQRVNAMSEWCEGFLLGLTLGGLKDSKQLDDELEEFIEDLVAFSHIDADTPPEEAEEAAYTELVEYIRVGMLNIYESRRRLH